MNDPVKRLRLLTLVLTLTLILVSCRGTAGDPTPTPFIEKEGEDPFIGVPNPASFYCQEMGYQLEMRETEAGTEGICIFPDGKECDEWEFLSGSCAIEWTFCQRQGSTIQAGEGNVGTCGFADGSSCPEYDYFIGECQAP